MSHAPPRGSLLAATAAALISILALALASAAPITQVLRISAEAVTAAAAVSAASTYLLGAATAEAASTAARRLDKDYRRNRGHMTHEERVRTAEAVVEAAALAAAARRLQRLWPVAAATLGIGGLYSASLAYTLLWRTARLLGPSCSPETPSPAAAYAVLFATLGTGGPLVANWATRLYTCITAAAENKGAETPQEEAKNNAVEEGENTEEASPSEISRSQGSS